MMTASIIGANEKAILMAKALEKAGMAVQEVYAEDIHEALELSETLYSAVAVNSLNFEKSKSELFLIVVPDEELSSIVSQLVLPGGVTVVHTSGNQPLSVLNHFTSSYSGEPCQIGVFFILGNLAHKSFSEMEQMPVLIEASNEKTYHFLHSIAKGFSKKIIKVNARERLVYQTALAFSCEFTNHLWAISKEILESENLDFELIKPIIFQTVKNMMGAVHPADVQTGAAVKNDAEIINNQLIFLGDDDDLIKVFTTLTESISDWHGVD